MFTLRLKADNRRCLRSVRQSSRKASGTKFGLELLEDRRVMATIPWVGGADQNWGNPANWAGGVLPDSTSDVVIGSAFTGGAITSKANVSIKSLNSAAPLTILGGTFNLGMGSSVINNTLTVSGPQTKLNSSANLTAASVHVNSGTWHQTGAVNVTSLSFNNGRIDGAGDIVVSGSFSWTAGILGGVQGQVEGMLSLGATATGSITGSTSKSCGRVVENAGRLTYDGAALYLGFGGNSNNVFNCTVNNLPTGTLTVLGSSSFPYSGSAAFGIINNHGTFTHGGVGTTTMGNGIRLNNIGTVNVNGGTLSALIVTQLPLSSATKTLAGGTWNVGADSTLTLGRSTTTTVTTNNATVTLSGANSVFTNINTLTTNNGSFQLRNGRTFATAGAFTNTGTVSIDGTSKLSVTGNFTQSSTGTLNVEAASTAGLSDRLTVGGISKIDGQLNTGIDDAQLPQQPGDNGGAVWFAGLLYVQGTDGDDRIIFRQHQGRIAIDGICETFAANEVRWIVVNALDGNDIVVLASDVLGGEAITAPAMVVGGKGDDFLSGGASSDLLIGGAGNDYLYGHSGNDLFLGNEGADALFGGDGDDVLDGGEGYDYLDGQAGNDTIFNTLGDVVRDSSDSSYTDPWERPKAGNSFPPLSAFGDLSAFQGELDEIYRRMENSPSIWDQTIPELGITLGKLSLAPNEWRTWNAP